MEVQLRGHVGFRALTHARLPAGKYTKRGGGGGRDSPCSNGFVICWKVSSLRGAGRRGGGRRATAAVGSPRSPLLSPPHPVLLCVRARVAVFAVIF